MRKENIEFKQPETVGTLVHVAVDGKYAGYIVISDEVKEDSKQAIQKLKELGIKKTVMLTGDAKTVGEAVGKELGLDEVHAELLPQQKVEEIEKIDAAKHGKEKIAFVGDGINDTPVLARADVGIAMGGLGSDAAIEAADIVIMTDEPSKIATAVKNCKTHKKYSVAKYHLCFRCKRDRSITWCLWYCNNVGSCFLRCWCDTTCSVKCNACITSERFIKKEDATCVLFFYWLFC